MKIRCPNCSYANKTFWSLNDGRLKCPKCGKKFSARRRAMIIDRKMLRRVIAEFVLEHSTNVILARVKISKYKLLKILTLLRARMTQEVPDVFDGIVEVDETYLGGQWKNKPLKIKVQSAKSKRGRGTTKQPAFGILCRNGKIWAELVSGVEADDLQPKIEQRVRIGSVVCSDAWRGYTGIAAKGYVHRLVEHGRQEYSDKRGGHINGLDGFWGYLKRKLAARGGIRRKRLHLYLYTSENMSGDTITELRHSQSKKTFYLRY